MANGLTIESCLKKLPLLLLCGVPLLALIAFSGSNIYWVQDAYDGWRIFQIILLMMLGAYALFIRTQNTAFSTQTTQALTFAFPVLFGLVLLSSWQAEHSARAAADAALYGLLAISVWAQADLFRKHPVTATHIAAWLAILPLFTIFPLLDIQLRASNSTSVINGHLSFSNIRMLDDALLPCLFLLWQRPAWLAHNSSKKPILNKIITLSVYLISTLYALIFWYDGARAVILSTLIGLGLIAIFRRDYWSKLRLPLFTLFGAGFLFLALTHLLPNTPSTPIIRTDSDGRDRLWLKTLQLWQENPILGVGGNNYVTSNPWILNGHPHNLPLQWLSEWGVAGLLAMLLLVPLVIQFFKHRQTLPAFVLGAVAAVGVDALFSGVMVYPLSQMLGVWSFAWLLSLLPAHAVDSKTPSISWQLQLKVIAVIAIFTMLNIHDRDITCRNCMSIDNDNAPRFWQYGRALHLVPIGSEAISNTPDALSKNH